ETMPYAIDVKHDAQLYHLEIPALYIPRCRACGELIFSNSVDDQILQALRAHLRLRTSEQSREVSLENSVAIAANVDPAARAIFYHLLDQVPEAEAVWAERQATLQSWRSDSRFTPYWPSIDQMLTDDFASLRRRAAARETVGHLEGYDYEAWREQRNYDLKHAHDHLS